MTPAAPAPPPRAPAPSGDPDHRVHERLRVRRLVALVVAVTAVADQVDDHVLAEFSRYNMRQPAAVEARLRVVRVDVEDRNVEALGLV